MTTASPYLSGSASTGPEPAGSGNGAGLRLGTGLAIYAGIVLVVVAIVFLADRSLDRQRAAERELDAERAALLVSSFLSAEVGMLRGLQTIFVGDLPSPVEIDVALSTLDVGEGGFLRVWFVDSAGIVLREARYVPGSDTQMRVGARIDTAASPFIAEIARLAASTRAVVAGAARAGADGTRGFFLVQAAYDEDRLLGYVGGIVSASLLEAQLHATSPVSRSAITVLVGRDTIVHLMRRSPPDLPVFTRAEGAVRPVSLPARTHPFHGEWSVIVEHRHRPWAELGLWSVPVAFALLLGIGLLHERRYLRRLADRSHELEVLSAELIRANRSKSEFLANVSHELRTPLNAIVGFTELLREGMYGELTPKQLAPIERIDASAAHLRQLVDQVLDLAKMAAGRVEIRPEPIALRPFVFEVATEIESLVNERGLALSLAVPSTLPRVRSDPTHLRQILLNLLGNAVKFTPSGAISVRARLVKPGAAEGNGASETSGAAGPAEQRGAKPPDPSLSWVALQVVDTGIGIAPGDQERIFEEFEQVNAGARGNSMERGTGLGLAVARRMAHLLGGDVTVESSLGEGSVFTLWLPVREEE